MPIRYLKAVSLWNKKQRDVNTSHVYAVPRKGTKEYDQVRAIMGVKDYEAKSEAVEKARAAGKAIVSRRPPPRARSPSPPPRAPMRIPNEHEDTRRYFPQGAELDLLMELSRRLQNYRPPPVIMRREEEETKVEQPPVPARRTKRGEILAQDPEYARFYEWLTPAERNALNTRRRDYISRLKMTPAEAIREAMERHYRYQTFKEQEEAEL
jgi:hypothetical protein